MGPDFTTDRYSQIESVVHLFYFCIYVHFAKLMNHLVINNINVHIFSHLTNLRKKQIVCLFLPLCFGCVACLLVFREGAITLVTFLVLSSPSCTLSQARKHKTVVELNNGKRQKKMA